MSSNTTIRMALEEMLSLYGDTGPNQILFTTFNLNTKFFEQNVLPLCCGFKAEHIKNHTISKESLNQALEKIKVVVAFDCSTQPEQKDHLKYGLLPVCMNNGRFHPKIVIMHGYDESGVEKTSISISSANLSFAGWCLNREIIGWCELDQTNNVEVIGLLNWLREKSESLYDVGDEEDCQIRKFLSDLIKSVESTVASKLNQKEYVPEIYIQLPHSDDSLVNRLSLKRKWESVTIMSPYWQGIAQTAQAFSAKNISFVPTVDNFGKYVFPLTEFKTTGWKEYISSKIFFCRNWQSDRFTHAKSYILSSNEMKRVCIGSANCTGPGLLKQGETRNVEAMLVWDDLSDRIRIPKLSELKEDMIADEESGKTGSAPPPLLPFEVAVLINWLEMLIVCRFRFFPGKKIDNVVLKIGSNKRRITEDTWNVPIKIPFSSGRRIRTFTVDYYENDKPRIFKGIVLNINANDITLGYAQKIPIDIILEELREFRKKIKRRRKNGSENDDDNPRLDTEVEELENSQFDFFGMYQGLYNLETYFENNPLENGFTGYGLTSLPRIYDAVINDLNDTPRARIRKYMLLTELLNIVLQHPTSDEKNAFLDKIQSELSALKSDVITLLAESPALTSRLRSKKRSKSAAKAFEHWFAMEAKRDD